MVVGSLNGGGGMVELEVWKVGVMGCSNGASLYGTCSLRLWGFIAGQELYELW
jgi:hypothetical protein